MWKDNVSRCCVNAIYVVCERQRLSRCLRQFGVGDSLVVSGFIVCKGVVRKGGVEGSQDLGSQEKY